MKPKSGNGREVPETSPGEAPGPFESQLAGLTLQAVQRNLAAAFADRENTAALFQELLARPRETRLEALESEEAFASPGLGHALLDRAEALLPENPREAGHLAALAAQIGSRLPAPWSLLDRESLQGRARSLEGEALRRQGGMAPARIAHRRAFRHLEVLPVGSVERADFCRYLARLRRDQGRDDEALALLARALERFASCCEPRRARECRLELAWMHLDDLETD
jgi:tetratricopeptide (TPR) repeat protein